LRSSVTFQFRTVVACCEVFALLVCYAAYGRTCLPTFRYSLWFQTVNAKQSKNIRWTAWRLKMGPIRCLETSNTRCVSYQKSEDHNYTAAGDSNVGVALLFVHSGRVRFVIRAPLS
jgi:hypothetical protein